MEFLHVTLQSQPVVLDRCPCTAVIAHNQCFGVFEMRRHRLAVNIGLQLSERQLHVCETLIANGATVRRFHMKVVTLMMNAVTTLHENHGLGRGEHVFAAYWAIAVSRTFDTFMRVLYRNGDACLTDLQILRHRQVGKIEGTYLAMKKILPKPFANTAYATVIAMVYVLLCVIIP